MITLPNILYFAFLRFRSSRGVHASMLASGASREWAQARGPVPRAHALESRCTPASHGPARYRFTEIMTTVRIKDEQPAAAAAEAARLLLFLDISSSFASSYGLPLRPLLGRGGLRYLSGTGQYNH